MNEFEKKNETMKLKITQCITILIGISLCFLGSKTGWTKVEFDRDAFVAESERIGERLSELDRGARRYGAKKLGFPAEQISLNELLEFEQNELLPWRSRVIQFLRIQNNRVPEKEEEEESVLFATGNERIQTIIAYFKVLRAHLTNRAYVERKLSFAKNEKTLLDWFEQFSLKVPLRLAKHFLGTQNYLAIMQMASQDRTSSVQMELIQDPGEEYIRFSLKTSFIQEAETRGYVHANPTQEQNFRIHQFLLTRILYAKLLELQFHRETPDFNFPEISSTLREALPSTFFMGSRTHETRLATQELQLRMAISDACKMIGCKDEEEEFEDEEEKEENRSKKEDSGESEEKDEQPLESDLHLPMVLQQPSTFVTDELALTLANILFENGTLIDNEVAKFTPETIQKFTDQLKKVEEDTFSKSFQAMVMVSNVPLHPEKTTGIMQAGEIEGLAQKLKFIYAYSKYQSVFSYVEKIDILGSQDRKDILMEKFLDAVERRRDAYFNELPDAVFEKLAEVSFKRFRGHSYIKIQNNYIEELIKKSEQLFRIVQSPVQLQVLDRALALRYEKIAISDHIKGLKSSFINQPTYLAARTTYLNILEDAFRGTAQRKKYRGKAEVADRLIDEVDEMNFLLPFGYTRRQDYRNVRVVNKHTQDALRKDLKDLIQIGSWFGFFEDFNQDKVGQKRNPEFAPSVKMLSSLDEDTVEVYEDYFKKEVFGDLRPLSIKDCKSSEDPNDENALYVHLGNGAYSDKGTVRISHINRARSLVNACLSVVHENTIETIQKVSSAEEPSDIRGVAETSEVLAALIQEYPTLFNHRNEMVSEWFYPSDYSEFSQQLWANAHYGMWAYIGIQLSTFLFKRVPGLHLFSKTASPFLVPIEGFMHSFFIAMLPFWVSEWVNQGYRTYGVARGYSNNVDQFFLTSVKGASIFDYFDKSEANDGYSSAIRWFWFARAIDGALITSPLWIKGLRKWWRYRSRARQMRQDIAEHQLWKDLGMNSKGEITAQSLSDDLTQLQKLAEREAALKANAGNLKPQQLQAEKDAIRAEIEQLFSRHGNMVQYDVERIASMLAARLRAIESATSTARITLEEATALRQKAESAAKTLTKRRQKLDRTWKRMESVFSTSMKYIGAKSFHPAELQRALQEVENAFQAGAISRSAYRLAQAHARTLTRQSAKYMSQVLPANTEADAKLINGMIEKAFKSRQKFYENLKKESNPDGTAVAKAGDAPKISWVGSEEFQSFMKSLSQHEILVNFVYTLDDAGALLELRMVFTRKTPAFDFTSTRQSAYRLLSNKTVLSMEEFLYITQRADLTGAIPLEAGEQMFLCAPRNYKTHLYSALWKMIRGNNPHPSKAYYDPLTGRLIGRVAPQGKLPKDSHGFNGSDLIDPLTYEIMPGSTRIDPKIKQTITIQTIDGKPIEIRILEGSPIGEAPAPKLIGSGGGKPSSSSGENPFYGGGR